MRAARWVPPAYWAFGCLPLIAAGLTLDAASNARASQAPRLCAYQRFDPTGQVAPPYMQHLKDEAFEGHGLTGPLTVWVFERSLLEDPPVHQMLLEAAQACGIQAVVAEP